MTESQTPYLSFSDRPAAASLVFKAAAVKNTTLMRSREVEEHRAIMTKLAEHRPTLPNLCIEEAGVGGVRCKWIYRQGAESDKVIMYIHGGSWMLGNLTTAQMPGELLAESTEKRVLVVDYRLSPEHPFPAGLDDCFAVFDGLLEAGYSENDIALFGDSAGGNLSLALLNRLKLMNRLMPLCVGVASPVTDMTLSSEIIRSRDDLIYTRLNGVETDIFTLYARENDRESPFISPLCGNLTGLPPILIHAGGDEPISVDCVAYAKKAYGQGVDIALRVYREMFHDFTIVGLALKESRNSISEFAEFYDKWFKNQNNV